MVSIARMEVVLPRLYLLDNKQSDHLEHEESRPEALEDEGPDEDGVGGRACREI